MLTPCYDDYIADFRFYFNEMGAGLEDWIADWIRWNVGSFIHITFWCLSVEDLMPLIHSTKYIGKL